LTRSDFQSVARLAVALCTAALACLFAAFLLGTERTWWIELARYVPFPVYLLPALVGVGLSLRLSTRWRLAALCALALVPVGVMGLQVNRGEEGHAPLRVMSFNIKAYLAGDKPGGYGRIAWEIALHDPDVLVMQDAGMGNRPEDLPQAFRAALGTREVYISGQYLVASRFPMQGCQSGDISFPGEEHHYVRCVVTAHGVPFDLVTAHLLSPREGLNATRHERLGGLAEWQENFEMRMIQAHKLARDLYGHARPLVLAGDLNAPDLSPVIATLRGSGLRDSFATAGLGVEFQEVAHSRDAAHGGLAVECAVWPMPVVAVQEGLQGCLPLSRADVRSGIGPLS
jgi:endonuclease/exonuclease/phosphatase (EEP) superfamily protein YafD